MTSPAAATWMQTTGAALLAIKRRSLSRLLMPAQDGHSVHGLLYLAAVTRELLPAKKHCQGRVDISG
jgi:hypothetical protein